MVCLTQNNIVDIVHVSFIHIIINEFLTDSPINILLSELRNLCVYPGTIIARVRDDYWHLWVGEGLQCLGHYVWLADIDVGHPKILLQLIQFTEELVRGSRP